MLQIIQKGLRPGQILWYDLSNGNQTKYMVMSRDQNAGRNHSIKTGNSSFGMLEEFIYLVTTVTNLNSNQEIESRYTSRDACYHLVWNVLSSSLLYKNMKINL
jgi:hypothetical protein